MVSCKILLVHPEVTIPLFEEGLNNEIAEFTEIKGLTSFQMYEFPENRGKKRYNWVVICGEKR